MSKIVKFASLSAAAVLSVSLLGACTDQHARDMAQEALDKANASQACCEKVDRMWAKIMGK